MNTVLFARLVMKVVVIAKKKKKIPKKPWNDCLLDDLFLHNYPTYRTLLACSAPILKITVGFFAWT